MKEGPFLTIPQIARKLNRTPDRCYQMIREGQLPATEVGGRLVVPRDAWLAWLKRKTQDALAQRPAPRKAPDHSRPERAPRR